MPAVKPHRMRSLSSPIRKAGPFQPEVAYQGPVLGIEQLLDRLPLYGVHLARVHDTDGLLSAQASTGVTAKLLGGSHSSRRREHLDPGRVLISSSLAQRLWQSVLLGRWSRPGRRPARGGACRGRAR